MKGLLRVFAAACAVVIGSCDEIEDPILAVGNAYRADLYGPAPEFTPVTETVQRVLLEDFTAHQCGNCPAAAVIAEGIAETANERVSVMAIHAGNLAVTDDDHFDTDWTTEEGDVFWSQLAFQANPLGRVNRGGGPANFLAPAEWEPAVAAALAAPPMLHLELVASWVPEANHLNLHVHGQALAALDGGVRLAVLILESGLVDYQLDYASDPEVIPDYTFNHLLRGSLTGALGLPFGALGDNAAAGEHAVASFTYGWNPAWDIAGATVLAVALDASGQVLNVAEVHPVE
jgi:hypothetical protein